MRTNGHIQKQETQRVWSKDDGSSQRCSNGHLNRLKIDQTPAHLAKDFNGDQSSYNWSLVITSQQRFHRYIDSYRYVLSSEGAPRETDRRLDLPASSAILGGKLIANKNFQVLLIMAIH